MLGPKMGWDDTDYSVFVTNSVTTLRQLFQLVTGEKTERRNPGLF